MSATQDQLIDLITKEKVDLLSYSFADLEPEAIEVLTKWLDDKNFPSDSPADLVGEHYVLAWFSDNTKLLIFQLNYQEEAQCGGKIIFSYDGKAYHFVSDTVECSG